ncbi:capsular biosynthesis protein [Fictibacillus arsenicus]|uniref:Capsular biosynthesis protein n=1 Tax=Fictibacillus arsenicus TaxID=255247 RepID=A0A1B1Z946_9BACL|nr:Wzz/FepE/Etk N-terminal domain-containing protein [Fictibacillus arsenicus]ANX13968.1 capsular biosynthesis protein [Fictibacillus arsenicus]
MEETINLKELFAILRKRLWLIISLTVIAAVTAGVISFYFLTPIYQASTQLLVNQSKEDKQIDINQVQTNLDLINTYNVIMKSPVILEKVIAQMNLDTTVGQINEQITVSSKENSQVVEVSVEDKDPAQAVQLANTIGDVFKKEIVTIMNVDNVSILSKAQLAEDPSPIKPKPLLNIAIALVVGLMAGVGLAFLLEYMDTTIKTEQDIENVLGLPVLGTISEFQPEKKRNKKEAALEKGGSLNV